MEDHIPLKNHLSMADTMGRIYGKIPRIITACANVAAIAVSVAAQITAISKALQICVSSVNPTILIVISASIVILYSMFGGIRSVTITDILQCATFTIMIPCIAYKVVHYMGMSVPQIFKAVSQSEKFQFSSIFQNKTYLMSLLAGWLASVDLEAANV